MTERAYDRIVTSAWIGLLLIAAIATVLLGMSRHARGDEIAGSYDRAASHRNYVPNSARNFRHRSDVQVVGGRCAACVKFPRTAGLYCGCCTADYLGMDNRDGRWNLARNWPRYLPRVARSAARAGMAEVTRGGRHVRAIIADLGNGLFRFYDPNSGKGRTHIHTGPLKGVVVDPNGARVRMAGAR